MKFATMHPEDVKAGIRKRFGTVVAFEREYGLPEKSVTDVLRGRLSGRVVEAVEDALSKPIPSPKQSEHSDSNGVGDKSHRLNAVGR